MASYAKLSRSIWTDRDFLSLSGNAQRLYMLLISQPDLSSVGILPYTPGRWSQLATDTDLSAIGGALAELEHARFVFVDSLTEELLIRSHIAHDSAWSNPNGQTSLRSGLAKILSRRLAAIVRDLLVSHGVDPNQAPSKGGRQAPSQAPSQGGASPQQPLANSHEPLTSSQQPHDVSGSPLVFLSDEQKAIAAAALDQWIAWKLKQPGVQHPARFEATLRTDAPTEWFGKIAEYLVEWPNATAEGVLYDVFRINPSNGNRRAV